ncbi:putative delta-endotoxin CytB [Rhizoctonia solani 123E]|uniref:Putative delta-endotoxin CytB n=1 Tax=Rhizoctonia solani 123E TaxID=1423351 RepID=A0A074SKL5_9AGAM|nr:putative delta-endotoxin CytB [Rhizoctonia solani 123E]
MSPLKVISTLPPNFQPVTEQLLKFISPHVKSSSDGPKFFDWAGFKYALDDYPGVDIVIEGFDSPSTSKVAFKELPLQTTNSLIVTLSMPIAKDSVIAALKPLFTDLQSAKDKGVASFKQISPGDPSKRPPVPAVHGWECRLLLLAEKPSRTSDFSAMVGTVQIASPKLSTEEKWYALDEASTEEITLNVTVMKLGVEAGFQGLSLALTYFDVVSTLPQDFKETAGQLVNFFSPHVNEISSGVKQLNWASLKDSVDDYPGIELVIAGFSVPGAVTTTFKDLPDYCAAALRDPLSVPIPSDLSSTLSRSFSDLRYAKQAGWADFKQRESTAQYGWEYRVLTMVPNPSVAEDFIALLATIQLDSPKISDESGWYEANQLYSTDISVNPVMMKLAVNKDFKALTTA